MKKHRKETMRSYNIKKLGENAFRIIVREFYTNNCCEAEELVVDKKTLEALLRFKDEEIRAQEQDDDHRAHNIYVYDDNYISELGFIVDSFTDDVEAELFVEQVLDSYGYSNDVIECAKYKFIHNLSIRQTAEMVNMSLARVHRIIKKTKPVLYNALKELDE